MRFALPVLLIGLQLTGPLLAQLTPQQREFDFQVLLSVFAKRYGPANWKREALGVDIFDGAPWMARVRAARNDVEFWQICSEFVARLQDGHSSFRTPGVFQVDSGLFVDIYDGKVLIENVDRSRYPVSTFPIERGDELAAIDGRPVDSLMDEYVRTRGYGNARGARRLAADALVFRAQALFPQTASTPDESDFLIRKADGTERTFRLTWLKRGVPATDSGLVPTPRFAAATGAAERQASTVEEALANINEGRNWAVPASDLTLQERELEIEGGEKARKSFVTGFGARNPYYALPAGFNLRLGRSAADLFITGTYTADNLRIGYLRIPHFGQNPAVALAQLDPEIAFLQANTDGLVVDISRNTGGGCVGLDYAARLIPQQFWFFGEHLRPTIGLRANYAVLLENSKITGMDKWYIDKYQAIVDELTAALKENRAMTGPIPACTTANPTSLAELFRPALFENEPARVTYSKPLIVLVDEFSISFGDIFPAMLQDNKRGPIVGMRTAGAGGSVSVWPAGHYSESVTSNTNSLVVRREPVTASGLPTAPLIENIGVIPDIPLDYMTRDNLLQNGRPFTDAFTRIIVDHIRASAPR